MAEEAELNLDEELDELENRLERLRALYEQYFLGIEKLEPSVPRKDVERRIWVLRRVKFKNTGKRFKFNVLTQRFNTFAQYWARICREIENGTYKRHLIKAEKTFGEPLTIAAKRRKGDFSKKKEEEAPPIEPAIEPAVDSLDTMLGLKPTKVPTAPGLTPGPFARKEPSTRPGRFQLEKLDLDIDDIIGGGAAPISKRPQGPVGPVRAKPAAAAPPPSIEPPPLSGPPVSRPGGGKAPPPVGPMVGARPRLPKGIAPPAEPPPAAVQPPPAADPQKPKPPPVPARAKPAPPPIPTRSVPPAAPAPAAPRARPPVAPPPSVRPAAPARPPAPAGSLSDDRLKEIHSRLLDAKRQTNDAKSVSLDGLSKQLKATEDKLRQQHGNRKIDFDVVIKDGKAVVKPIVK